MKRELLFAVLLLLPMLAMAQNKKVAVYVNGENAGINKVLGSKLVSAIARSEEYSAIERTSSFLAELSKEQKYQRTGAVDDNELSRLGKQFGVQYICVAAVSEAFNEQYLSARIINVESAQVERTASSSGSIHSLDALLSAADAVAGDLLSSLRQRGQATSPKVAVYVIKNDAGKDIGRVLGDKLVAGFTNSGKYIAIERTNSFLQQLSKEQKYQRTGAVDDNDISRLGRQFGVQYVCVADVSDVFGEKFISSRLIDVETAEVVNSHDAGGAVNNMGNCVRLANEIASNLSKGTFAEQAEEARRAEQARKAEQARRAEQERKAAERRVQLKAQGWVDLGLPSGTLWKDANEPGGLYTYEQAVSKFGNKLPTRSQLEELKYKCTWRWNGSGYKVTGPNGESIVLPVGNSIRMDVGFTGFYWSSSPGGSEEAWVLYFDSAMIAITSEERCDRHSVRLVQD